MDGEAEERKEVGKAPLCSQEKVQTTGSHQ